MKSESVVIHKGGKEEKYKIYVEDYVVSYLKFETGTLELSEIFFYGYRERNAKEYIIYGAGKDKQLAVFDKYDLLETITCRLTQMGPVFMVREKDGLYEVKGYDIFYHNNEEMQSYLIDRKQQYREENKTDKQPSQYMRSGKQAAETAEIPRKYLHNTMSLQLGVIFVILIAIVINSTNSYDKMEQLNQSAREVFFAIENQEADGMAHTNGAQEEIVVERNPSGEDTGEEDKADSEFEELEESAEENEIRHEETENSAEDILKSVSGETKEDAAQNEGRQEETENNSDDASDLEAEDTPQEDDTQQQNSDRKNEQVKTDSAQDESEDTEALSRNITRYYEIERGDTLYTISEEIYGDISKVQQICELNQISDPDHIRYGQKIILP